MSDKNTLILKQSGMPEDFGFVMRNRAPMHVLPENELHWHDYFEMEFVYDGCGTQIVNAKTIPMSRGSVYLLTPLDFHTVIADETCGMSLMNINFTDKYLPPEIAAALSNGFLFSQLEEETFAPLYAIVERMYEEYTNANPYRETAICAMLTQICIALLRRCECIPVQKQDSTDAIIQDAILYLQKHFKNPPKKQELARKYPMSANYFGVRFQRAVGLSYTEYLKNLRLQQAVDLLLHSELSVEQISEHSGFHAPTYFIHIFRERYGIPPLQYRKRYKKT